MVGLRNGAASFRMARSRIIVLLPTAALVVSACTGNHAKAPKTPASICKQRFSNVLDAQANTVRGVTEVGPRRRNAPAGHLGNYTGDTPVTLCLVGKPSDQLDDAIAITPDGKTYTTWRQGGAMKLEPPS